MLIRSSWPCPSLWRLGDGLPGYSVLYRSTLVLESALVKRMALTLQIAPLEEPEWYWRGPKELDNPPWASRHSRVASSEQLSWRAEKVHPGRRGEEAMEGPTPPNLFGLVCFQRQQQVYEVTQQRGCNPKRLGLGCPNTYLLVKIPAKSLCRKQEDLDSESGFKQFML
jgi:hypothetical protein